MATFISVPLKKSSEVDLVKPLTKFISATYSAAEDQGEYVRAAEELNKLRKSAVGRPLDKHESSLEVLLRYYDQLCAIEPKFPFSENQLCLTFTWKDAFDKGSLFGGSVKLALASLGYEKSCVLFNIGALASQIAYEQNFDNDEGLKTAAKYYQLASGAFSYIKDTVLSALNREPTMDISPDAVGALSQIMLAQAQEVFFLKATSDKMKDAIIARLANQAADFYGDAFKQCQYKENLPKYFYFQEVLPVLAAKHCIMQANAEYHQSLLAKQQKKFGEEIGRLQHATELVKTVASRYDEYINVKDLSDKISRALTAAKKDNDFIYHDRVPDLKDLEAIGKAALVKSTVIKVPISQKFTDLFEKMVPLAVQHSMSVYNSRKAEIVNRLIGQMREATNLSNGVLASLNLPAAVEDLSGDSIPQSILEKSRAIIQQGGLQSIDQLIKDLPELLQRNREILDESVRILDEEEATDNELRNKFGQRWQRTASNDLYKPLRTEGGNLCKFLDQAVQADKVVKERYSTHRDMIALLCKPEAELNAAMPSANPAKTLQGSEVVSVLRALLANINEVKMEREKLENDIKSAQCDMTSKFLTALAQDGAINEEAISVTELDNIYGGYTQKVQQSLKNQEEILGNIQNSHQEFSTMKQSNADANQREEMLKKLAAAHDSYVELSNNLREGTKFYNELTEILLKFQNKCSDIVFARKTERDELLKDLQQNIARQPSAPSFPAVPAYQSTPSSTTTPATATSSVPTPAPRTVFQSKPQPPARPPPPAIQAQAANTSTPPVSGAGPIPPATQPVSTPGATPSIAQGPPYPTYQGYPGCYQMPVAYNPYAYGQYNMPYMYQAPGQAPYPNVQHPQQPQQPGYPYPQQPYYPQQ
ncbi:programmed cell death 6-interacting protein-like isoform X1 [Acipenser oxyrinchus oxyrinchus]|uniref:Programmed cell death 6-interacting protein n=1 Tax=Acipenser oxyrinchus oxyrinchus TaxID=40147 RepID=A0AAD8GFS8_ACIOX|nr:programmed cell death 6-interacting protein-like isoform X1 [Acipenser oxyrinchus oxyrinchus]